jgi:hypothetical protein
LPSGATWITTVEAGGFPSGSSGGSAMLPGAMDSHASAAAKD